MKEMFNRCDNASSHHRNFYGESLYKICKTNGIALRRLDYNEPQKGKDQCDRDSAVARNVLRCFVDVEMILSQLKPSTKH